MTRNRQTDQTHCPDCGRPFASPAAQLARLQLLVAEARAAKMEADKQDWPPKGIAYEDLPPLHPEDVAMLREKLSDMLGRVTAAEQGGDSGESDDDVA